MLEKTDFLVGSENIEMNNKYTLHMDADQKDLFVKALEKYSQMSLGQTGEEFDAAKKLFESVKRSRNATTINLVGE